MTVKTKPEANRMADCNAWASDKVTWSITCIATKKPLKDCSHVSWLSIHKYILCTDQIGHDTIVKKKMEKYWNMTKCGRMHIDVPAVQHT